MKLCQVERQGDVLTCRVCGVPFDDNGPFAITPDELAKIRGRLDRIYRPCPPLFGAPIAAAPQRGVPMPIEARPRLNIAECIHRGEPLGTELCPTCSGTVHVKVFACAVHERCELVGKLGAKGIKFCGACEELERRPDSGPAA